MVEYPKCNCSVGRRADSPHPNATRRETTGRFWRSMKKPKPIDLGAGECVWGSGYKVIITKKITLETGFAEDKRTPFRVGKKYRIYAVEVR